ncbi:MAG: ATP-binding protein [Acidobacteria bacterium]|nr:ATP-binding protein [Acidobacteriota bacterium]
MIDSSAGTDPAQIRGWLRQRLAEPAPGRIQLVTGPRQVGKTTLLLELAAQDPEAALYAAADAPEAGLPGYWDRLWASAEAKAASRQTLVLLDEIHLLPDWAASLKAYWDRFRRRRLPIHIVATGSSALRVTQGSRESLAGRFERIVFAHWSASALAKTFEMSVADAARHSVLFGTYPGAWTLRDDRARWRAYIRDAIIEPAIGRDVLALGQVRRPALLRQVFAVAAGSPAHIVSLQKLQGRLADRGALETVAHYLGLLQEAYLVAGVEKFSKGAVRRRAAPPKLVTLNNALLSAMHPDGPPDVAGQADRLGAWIENACLASAINQGQRVTYWREEPLEVDAVIEGSWGSWAVEVKSGRFESRDLGGLMEFSRRHPAFRPLVITRPGDEATALRFGLDAISWIDFLGAGPSSTRAGPP